MANYNPFDAETTAYNPFSEENKFDFEFNEVEHKNWIKMMGRQMRKQLANATPTMTIDELINMADEERERE